MSSPCHVGLCRAVTGSYQSPMAGLAPSTEILHTPQLAQWKICPRKHCRHHSWPDGVCIHFSQAQAGCVWPSLHLSLTVLCLGPCSLLTQQQPLLLPGSSCTLKALGCSLETYLWMTLVLAYRTACINASDTLGIGEKRRHSHEFWLPLSKSSQDWSSQPQRPKPTKVCGHQSQQYSNRITIVYTSTLSSMFD